MGVVILVLSMLVVILASNQKTDLPPYCLFAIGGGYLQGSESAAMPSSLTLCLGFPHWTHHCHRTCSRLDCLRTCTSSSLCPLSHIHIRSLSRCIAASRPCDHGHVRQLPFLRSTALPQRSVTELSARTSPTAGIRKSDPLPPPFPSCPCCALRLSSASLNPASATLAPGSLCWLSEIRTWRASWKKPWPSSRASPPQTRARCLCSTSTRPCCPT